MAKNEAKLAWRCEHCGQQTSARQAQELVDEARRQAEEKIRQAQREVLELIRQREGVQRELATLRATLADLGGTQRGRPAVADQPSGRKRRGWLRRG